MEDLHFMRLWDRYSPLLTKTQQEIGHLYFECDLSLGEIAEEKGCSRQSVLDCLNISRKKLEEYEEKLHCVSLMEAIEVFGQAHPEHGEEIERILESGRGE